MVVDRRALRQGGALALRRAGNGWEATAARPRGEARPWVRVAGAGLRASTPRSPARRHRATPRREQRIWGSTTERKAMARATSRGISRPRPCGISICVRATTSRPPTARGRRKRSSSTSAANPKFASYRAPCPVDAREIGLRHIRGGRLRAICGRMRETSRAHPGGGRRLDRRVFRRTPRPGRARRDLPGAARTSGGAARDRACASSARTAT